MEGVRVVFLLCISFLYVGGEHVTVPTRSTGEVGYDIHIDG